MNIRKTSLAGSWYPNNSNDCKATFSKWDTPLQNQNKEDFVSAIVPHAGWFFSGKTAYHTFFALHNSVKISSINRIFIFGGHHVHHEDMFLLDYEALDTPLGLIQVDQDALKSIKNKFLFKSERMIQDNTIEINLPFIKYFFPDTPVLALYPSFNNSLFTFICDNFKDSLFVASADLTHYGSNYGFAPQGSGAKAYDWAKKNDYILIDAIIEGKFKQLVSISEKYNNTCSINSINAVCQISSLLGITKGKLIDYSSSYEIQPSSSFVGYCGIVL